jgi:hypothetical protein
MKPDCPTFDRIWRAACTVDVCGRAEIDAMIRRHYLGKWPGVCVLALVMRRDGETLGMCVFALPPRETSKRYGGTTWELARLWLDDMVPQNAETWLIARAVRHIRQHHPEVEILVSYADPSVGHAGTIYKAANWTSDGRTDQERKSPRCDYRCIETGKHYSRRGHVPAGVTVRRVPRISKHRFIYLLRSSPTMKAAS